MRTQDALRRAQEKDLDLVEVAAEAKPPVVRILDYSKYKYEQAQKLKSARKHQQQINVREIKFRPKIAQHDYDTKKGHVERFLKARDKVKVTIMFRGRRDGAGQRLAAASPRHAFAPGVSGELAEYAARSGRTPWEAAAIEAKPDVKPEATPDAKPEAEPQANAEAEPEAPVEAEAAAKPDAAAS